MNVNTSNLQQTAMAAGYMLYMAAGLTFCLLLQLLERTEHYSGPMYVIAMAGWVGMTVSLPLMFAQCGRKVRRAAGHA